MEKLEILPELPKCYTETQHEQNAFEQLCPWLHEHTAATNPNI